MGKSLIWVGAALAVVILLVVGYVVFDRFYSDSPVSQARLPDCVIGVWKFDSDMRTVEIDSATSTSSTVNATLEYTTDKTAVVTYTNATKQTTTYKDGTSNTVREIAMVGTITYRYSISGSEATYTNARGAGTYTITQEGRRIGSGSLSNLVNSQSVTETLTCSRRHLVETGERTSGSTHQTWETKLSRV